MEYLFTITKADIVCTNHLSQSNLFPMGTDVFHGIPSCFIQSVGINKKGPMRMSGNTSESKYQVFEMILCFRSILYISDIKST